MKIRPSVVACALALPVSMLLGACSLTESNKTNDQGSGPITVTSSDKACTLSRARTGSGKVSFKVKNTGSKVTEFYLYAADGKRIVGEVENVGPGLSRDLVISATPGTYVTACKPGMKGAGIRGKLTVTDSGKTTSASDVARAAIEQATDSYADYVKDQADDLLAATTKFVEVYASGDDATARKLYPSARSHWERIEPVAESFGDLDPKMDSREADLEQGQPWTGWHRIEKDLWPPAGKGYTPLSKTDRRKYGDDLLANTTTLHTRVQTTTYDVAQIGNGAKELLDEVATGKITGEEDIWSHTDLFDLQANVEGAKEAFEVLEPVLEAKDDELADQIDTRFDALQAVLDRHKSGYGFVSYDKVTDAQRKELSDAVNALSEPLSKMTGVVTQ